MTKMEKKGSIYFVAFTLIAIVGIIIIGPMDIFTHGFYYDEINCDQILPEDFQSSVDLKNEIYEMIFSPQKPHFAGFEIYLTNQPNDNKGALHLSIENNQGKVIDNIYVDLSEVRDASWYKVYTSADLKKNQEYVLKFCAEDCSTAPHLQNVDSSYLPKETLTGRILLSYAYAKSTYTFQNKIIISLFVIAIWGFICSNFVSNKLSEPMRIAGICIFLTAVLTWNYMYNSMDNQNTNFSGFQVDSEALVTSVIYAEQDETYFRNTDEMGFGLGEYYDLKGGLRSYGLSFITDSDWLNGYSRSQGAVIVNSNIYSNEVAVAGNYMAFSNGESFQIKGIENSGSNIIIHLNTDSVLTFAKYGNLDDVLFYDQYHQPLVKSRVTAYKSQYGLQGKIFRHLARYMEEDQILGNLNLLCSFATAFVFVMITMLIAVKYDMIMAVIFYITFWLSPWIVNFARNLYWVEFTWFLPMLFGLFCSWKIENINCRIVSYIGIFIAIFGKCMCGYEYVSTIMMGMVAFLLVDFLLAALAKNKSKAICLFRTLLIIGLISIMAFITVICIHAKLRGSGNIFEGIKSIFEHDVLRRTSGANLNDFSEVYWSSINASIWETFSAYFHFGTEIITGVKGNLFSLLCITPLFIFLCEYHSKKMNIESFAMYIVFFFSSVSWFCLAKGHSYIHRHMNFVLWYFGFIQICMYIIVDKIIKLHKGTYCKKKRGV